MAAERSIWEAWNAKGATRIEVLTAKEIAFVNIFGTFRANKAHLLGKSWLRPGPPLLTDPSSTCGWRAACLADSGSASRA